MVKATKGTRATGAARDNLTAELGRKYQKGATIRELAEQTGRSYGFVRRLLTEAGVPLRSRGGANRDKHKQPPPRA